MKNGRRESNLGLDSKGLLPRAFESFVSPKWPRTALPSPRIAGSGMWSEGDATICRGRYHKSKLQQSYDCLLTYNTRWAARF